MKTIKRVILGPLFVWKNWVLKPGWSAAAAMTINPKPPHLYRPTTKTPFSWTIIGINTTQNQNSNTQRGEKNYLEFRATYRETGADDSMEIRVEEDSKQKPRNEKSRNETRARGPRYTTEWWVFLLKDGSFFSFIKGFSVHHGFCR